MKSNQKVQASPGLSQPPVCCGFWVKCFIVCDSLSPLGGEIAGFGLGFLGFSLHMSDGGAVREGPCAFP